MVMQCPLCPYENPADAKFCNQCGTALNGQNIGYAARFLEQIFDRDKCDWCRDPSRALYRRHLCRRCYDLLRRLAKAEAILSEAKSSSQPFSQILWLELKVKDAQSKVKLVQAEGFSYGAIHERQVEGIDIEYQFSALSKSFVGKDIFYGHANLFDWCFTADQKRLILYFLSRLHREKYRRHMKSIAQEILS
jgi:hypothetical protein